MLWDAGHGSGVERVEGFLPLTEMTSLILAVLMNAREIGWKKISQQDICQRGRSLMWSVGDDSGEERKARSNQGVW